MWAGNSGAWPQGQWPLQQSAYQNIPHEQVDWAALAQQWIQMKEAMNETCDAQPAPVSQSSHCPPSRPPPQQPPPHLNRPLLPRPVGPGPIGEGSYGPPPLIPERNLPPGPGHGPIESSERDTDNNDNNWNSGGSGYWPSSSWNSGPPNWPPSHPPDNRDPPFEFGRNHGNQGYGVQTYNYNHGSDQFYFNQTGEQSSYNQYWTQSGSVNPPFVRGNLKERQTRGESPVVAEEETPAPFNLDAVKCKNLPAWIREGLEKMDRDKQKKLDRERMLQEREERLRRQQEEEEQVLREIQATKEKASMYQVRKSKFESDSEEDGDSPDVRTRSPSVRRSVSPFQRKTPSPIVTPKTEQEKLEEMMLKVRRMLTEILMEVTNEEISVIAKEIFNRERIKAPAQQLAKSSALASITDSLGLGDYGSDSETSGAEQEKGEDSDAELQGSIQRRKAEFAEREKQIAAAFKNDLSADDDETEDEGRKGAVRAPERSKQGEMAFIPSINSESGRERYHFEKKYAEIPGLGTQDDEFKRESTTSAAATSKPGGTSGVDKVKSSSTESSRSTRSQSRSDSETSSDNSRKRKRRSSSKEKHGGSESSRSRSPPESSGRRNSRRDSSDIDERASSGNRSGKNGREKDRRKRSVSRERRYRRPSDSRSSSRRSRSRSRERRRNSYNSGRRRSQRSRSRSRSYERSRYHRRDSRKRSRSRSSSSRSDRSRSRERRNSRRSHSRSPSKRESIWAGKK